MTKCQAPHCHRPAQMYLCQDHTQHLGNMLDQLPSLLDELDTRIQQLARTTIGTIGRTNRDPAYGNPIDFDAAEQARQVRKLLLRWVETVAVRHTGRIPPALRTTDTKTLARWLYVNLKAIAQLPIAGTLYQDIARLVGTDSRGGQLHKAIQRQERHLVGPCPTTTGRNHNGQPRHCGRILFADTYDEATTCSDCGQEIDVKHTRLQAAAQRDLHTKASLIDVLANMDEPIAETRITQWIKARRLRPAGYKHDGIIIQTRIIDTDEPVYSLERTRKLRHRDQLLTRGKRLLTR